MLPTPEIVKIYVFLYPAWHVIVDNLNAIPDSRVCNISSLDPSFVNIDFPLKVSEYDHEIQYNNQTLQANPWHREEDQENIIHL